MRPWVVVAWVVLFAALNAGAVWYLRYRSLHP